MPARRLAMQTGLTYTACARGSSLMTSSVASVLDRLRYVIRERDGDNDSAVARRLGMHQTTISRIKAGTTEPKTKTLEKFAAAYRLNLSWLLTGEGEPFERGTAGHGPGYGDGPADKIIRDLDFPEDRLPLPARIKEAYVRAVDDRIPPPDFVILDSWRDRKLSRPDKEW